VRIANLAGISFKSISRHLGQTLVLAGGISVGVASLIFLFSLLTGVEDTVRKRIIEPFPETHIRVERSLDERKSRLFNIDEKLIRRMRKRPEVLAVYPRMKPDFPCEIAVTIPPKFYWVKFPEQSLPINIYGIEPAELGNASDRLRMIFESYNPDNERIKVPFVINEEFYLTLEKGVIPEHFPFLMKKDFGFFSTIKKLALKKGSLREEFMSWPFRADLGASMEGAEAKAKIEMKLVGFSRKVPVIGVSVPARALYKWYEYYHKRKNRPVAYHNAVIVAKDPTQVGSLVKELSAAYHITSGKEVAEKVTMFFRVVQMGVTLVGLIILILSGVGIFLGLTINVMVQASRIAILRAVGARRWDIGFVYVFEAAFIGFIGGIVGVFLSYLAMWIADSFAVARLPDFPLKPETFFMTPWWYLAGAIIFGIAIAIAAGLPPALRAARVNVARVLR
jgi:ABC-type lipoprotein release transport system permease subunit